jgi:hypothetical protein
VFINRGLDKRGMVYIHNTILFSLKKKKNEILSFVAKWMEMEDIILSEISQTQKDKYCMFSLICGS